MESLKSFTPDLEYDGYVICVKETGKKPKFIHYKKDVFKNNAKYFFKSKVKKACIFTSEVAENFIAEIKKSYPKDETSIIEKIHVTQLKSYK